MMPELIKHFNRCCYAALYAVIPLLALPCAVSADVLCIQQKDAMAPCSYELPRDTIDQLKIDAGFGWGIFSGSIYNGDSAHLITRLVVSMEPIHDHHHMDMMGDMHVMSHETKIHEIKMNLPPLTKGALSMALPAEDAPIHDFKWEVIKVYGYAVENK
ncbi:MAG: hypothetical protein LV471_05750 [Nitrosomonas sp.]|nr:hypothetical protein [Nitrosomonas sp.]